MPPNTTGITIPTLLNVKLLLTVIAKNPTASPATIVIIIDGLSIDRDLFVIAGAKIINGAKTEKIFTIKVTKFESVRLEAAALNKLSVVNKKIAKIRYSIYVII